MAHDVQWYIPNRVISVQHWDPVDLADVLTAIGKINELVNIGLQANHAVHTVLDMRRAKGNLPLTDIPRIVSKLAFKPSDGWMIIIQKQNPMQRFVTSVVMQQLHLRTRFVTTAAEAEALLHEVDDDSLDWNQADNEMLICPVCRH